ncbi:MAG TPA: hypothetical protein DD727_09590 [Clostridiales bacterium]|nr:hypothetical protein [Clostridiales bacterium]
MLALLGFSHKFSVILRSKKGVSTLEIVIIAAILIGLALIFKDRIVELVELIFDRIFSGAEEGLDFGIPGTNEGT